MINQANLQVFPQLSQKNPQQYHLMLPVFQVGHCPPQMSCAIRWQKKSKVQISPWTSRNHFTSNQTTQEKRPTISQTHSYSKHNCYANELSIMLNRSTLKKTRELTNVMVIPPTTTTGTQLLFPPYFLYKSPVDYQCLVILGMYNLVSIMSAQNNNRPWATLLLQQNGQSRLTTSTKGNTLTTISFLKNKCRNIIFWRDAM